MRAAVMALIAVAAGCASPRPPVRRPRAAPTGDADTGSRAKTPWQLFTEDDALKFAWGSAAVAATAYFTSDPSDDPRGFSPDEGGAEMKAVTIPNWQVGVGVSAVPVLIAASDSRSRWYHAKGAVESLLTTAALTELSKNIFHRHRPRYGGEAIGSDDRKSFFSGHSSLTLAATTYAGLYLHHRVFSRWRGDSSVAWWEVPPYLALAALSIWVPYTRIEDNMHHPSDVLVGGLVGVSLSAAFFTWQERRYARDHETSNVIVTPLIDTPGAAVLVSFD